MESNITHRMTALERLRLTQVDVQNVIQKKRAIRIN
jgi:hypothetical protein